MEKQLQVLALKVYACEGLALSCTRIGLIVYILFRIVRKTKKRRKNDVLCIGVIFIFKKGENKIYIFFFFLFQIKKFKINYLFAYYVSIFRCGLVVRIPGFHPGGPGSIPGTGTTYFIFPLLFVLVSLLYGNHIFL